MKRSVLTERSGALLTVAPIVLLFAVGGAAGQIDAYWTNPAGGNWVDGPNWSTNPAYPNNGGSDLYNATIDMAGNPYTVSLNSSVELENFTLNSTAVTLHHTGGTLAVHGTANVQTGTYRLDGGTIVGGAWNVAPGRFLITTNANNCLDGVAFTGNLDLSSDNARLRIANGLLLNGALNIGGQDARVTFEGNQVFDNALVNFGSSQVYHPGYLSVGTGGSLTLGPGAHIGGTFGTLDGVGTILNQGRISADGSRRRILVTPSFFTNEGVCEVANSGALILGAAGTTWTNAATGTITATGGWLGLDGDWTNAGTISAVNTVVALGGTFSTADIGTFTRSGGEVRITGTMDNSGDTLNLNAATGTWVLYDGTIRGGTINFADGAALRFWGSTGQSNYLDGVTLNGPLELPYGMVRLGNTTTYQGAPIFSGNATLGFDTDRVLDNQSITLGTQSYGGTISAEGPGTLTLGPNLSIQGRGILDSALFIVGDATIRNQGMITANVANQTLAIRPSFFVNEGQLEATDGGKLQIGAAQYTQSWTNASTGVINARNASLEFGAEWANAGTVNLTQSTLDLKGTFATPDIGTINRDASSIINIRGLLDNTGHTINLNAATGSWNMWGGTVRGGTLNFADGEGLSFGFFGGGTVPTAFLDNVTVNGDLTIDPGPYTGSGCIVRLGLGTVVNGDIEMRDSFYQLYVDGGQTLDNSTISLYTAANELAITPDTPGTLTFGPNLVVRGGAISGHGEVINQGLMTSDAVAAQMVIGGYALAFTNTGTILAQDDGSIEVGYGMGGDSARNVWLNAPGGVISAVDSGRIYLFGQWRNEGIINVVDDATLKLGGSFTTADIGTLNRSGGSIKINGNMDNTGDTFVLDSTTGSWELDQGTIIGGTLRFTEGQRLVITTNGANTLRGVTIDGDLVLDHSSLTIENGITAPDGIVFRGAGDSLLYVSDTPVLDNMTVHFEAVAGPGGYGTLRAESPGVTFGPNLIVHGGEAQVWGWPITNQGLISADAPGEDFELRSSLLTNDAIIEAVNGGHLILGSTQASTFVNNGTVQAVGARVDISGVSNTNHGTFVVSDGGQFRILQPDYVTNLSGNTLTGGTWAVFGDYSTLDIVGATITTNAADVTLSGQWSGFAAFDSLASNQGVLTLLDDRDFTTAGDLLNTGTLHLGPGCLLTVSGVFDADPAATLACELAGLGLDHHGRLLATGSALLDGDLRIMLSAGYTPQLGDTYEVLRAGSLLGTFSGYDLPLLPGGLLFDVAYGTRAVTLTVIPEPATLGLLAVALLMLRRRR